MHSLGVDEGGYSVDPHDGGNWTSGKPGVGELRGTMFGISAAAYPSLNIASLTLAQADAIRRADYWDKVAADKLPPALAFLVADAAYMSGPVVAVRQLQAVLGVSQDGVVGEVETLPAIARRLAAAPGGDGLSPLAALLVAYCAERTTFESALATWATYRDGWTARLFRTLLLASALA